MNLLSGTGVSTSTLAVVRYVSSKYTRPHPRPYKRRLFEAAVAPVLPLKVPQCAMNYANALKQRQERMEEYAPIELALVEKVRNWINEERFRVMAVCQLLPTSGRTLTFMKNRLRLNNVHFGGYGNRIMRKVFEGTPFTTLNPLFQSYGTCCLYSEKLEAIKSIMKEAENSSFIVPLAVTVDSRILSVDEVKQLASLGDFKELHAHTVGLLQAQPVQLTQTLDHHARDLVLTLDRIK